MIFWYFILFIYLYLLRLFMFITASGSMSFDSYGIIPGALYDAFTLILTVILLLVKSPAASAVF